MSFLDGDDTISKFLFVVMLLIAFIISLNLIITLISYLFSPDNKYIIKGIVPGNVPIHISQEAGAPGAIPIERSKNKEGIVFSWSVWLNITDIDVYKNQYKHIFHKGEQNINSDTGINTPNNSPGLYLSPNTNELIVIMNTYNTINEEIRIPNMPMNKWVNVIIRVMNTDLDVYINGSLAKRHVLSSVPKQNYGDIYIASNGGFTGSLSDLKYYSEALSPGEIISLSNRGPNLTINKKSTALYSNPPYLSVQWYTNNA
jgi:hypothetical protein